MIAGGGWVLAQSLVSQGAAFAARMVVYRTVPKDEIALAVWATSACAVLTWMQLPVSDVLVQRQGRFGRWANGAFWLSLAGAAAVMLGALALAPLLSMASAEGRVMPLALCTALGAAPLGLSGVWAAEAAIGFQFRRIAAIAAGGALATAGTAVGLAAAGAGAWAVVAPPAMGNGVVLAAFVITGKFRPGKPQWPAALRLLTPAAALAVGALFSNVMTQVDNFVIGLYDPNALAAYALAFALTFQLLQLMSRSVRAVLLPGLAAVDPRRWEAAYLHVLRGACVVCMPAALLTVPAVGPAIRLLFTDRWDSAVPLAQLLLAGMGFIVVQAIAFTAMQSRGRFGRYVAANMLVAAAFAGGCWAAAATGGAMAVAVAASALYAFTGLACAIAALPLPTARAAGRVVWAILLPTLLAAGSLLAAVGIVRSSGLPPAGLGASGTTFAIGVCLYAFSAWMCMRPALRSLAHRLPRRASREGASPE
jgi:PST family polysaccharide transporter